MASHFEVKAQIQTFLDVMKEEVAPVAQLSTHVSKVVATLVRENLRALAEDMSWVPSETRVTDNYLEVRFRISLSDLEAAGAQQEANIQKAFETSRRQVANLLEE